MIAKTTEIDPENDLCESVDGPGGCFTEDAASEANTLGREGLV